MGGPIEITTREIYDAVITLTTQVTSINGKVDHLCDNGRDHEARIRSLESRRWPLRVVGVILPLAAIGISALAFLGACS